MDSTPIYPDCPTVTRIVTVGGMSRLELLADVQRNGVMLNESAEQLFASELFITSATRYAVPTVELTVGDLGLAQGGTIAAIYERAASLGLRLCPMELAPHLRLQYRDQPEGFVGQPVRQHQAPYGSITVASAPLTDDDAFPKGFYLRRIEGVLWLRGYRSGADHIWNPDDHFIFHQP